MLGRQSVGGAAIVRLALSVPRPVRIAALKVAPFGAMAAVAALMFYPVWLQHRIYVEPDTVNYYYPALLTWQGWLRQGQLLLWTPYTLSGFPLFAEGEVGMLYPLHAAMLFALPFDLAFALIPIVHQSIAGCGAYVLAKRLTASRLAALIGGLAFGFGGLMIAQIHHTDVHSGFAWLPWVFWAFERSRQAGLRAASPWVVAIVGFLALQLLTVHPQVPLTTLFGLSVYAAVRSLLTHDSLPGRLRGVLRAAVAIGIAGLAAVCLTAIQIVPLAEVGLHSQRTNGWDYGRATEYSQSLWNLVTAIFPLFYFDRFSLDWGYWVRWEAPIYVGVPTLALALLGLVAGRSRARIAFAMMGLLAIWISLADYSPINLHWLLYQLPGFSVFRAPGRFAVLYDLAAAMLAAQGAAAAVELFVRRRRSSAMLLAAWTGLAVAVPAIVLLGYLWLHSDRVGALAWLRQTYLAGRRADASISADRVLSNLLDVMAFWTNARTATGVGLLLATTILLWSWWYRPRLRVWPAALVVLLAADLLVLGTRYHGTAPIAELPAQSETARFVIANRGLHRVLSVNDPNTRALRLMPFETATVGGDSSLQTATDAQFASSVAQLDNGLLDLWNVRYVVQRKGRFGPADADFPGPAWYNRTLIDPDRPIARLVAGTPEESVELRAPRSFPATELRIASLLRYGAHAHQGDAVGEVAFELASGHVVTETIQAGVQTAEWAAARPDVAATLGHRLPAIAYRYPNDPERRQIYFGTVPAPADQQIRAIRIQVLDPKVWLMVHGLALAADDGRTWQLGRYDKTRYRAVAEDRESVVYENLAVMPRAFLVRSAQAAEGPFDALARLRDPWFDPRLAVVVEGIPPVVPDVPLEPGDWVAVDRYEATVARYQVSATVDRVLVVTDSMFAGWAATVDGQPVRIWSADGEYRAVRVPAGDHVVEFRFDPASLRAGALVSGIAACSILGYLAVALKVRRRRSWSKRDQSERAAER